MTIERHEPDYFSDERTMLDAWLDYHRATLAWKCEGSTDDQLRRAIGATVDACRCSVSCATWPTSSRTGSSGCWLGEDAPGSLLLTTTRTRTATSTTSTRPTSTRRSRTGRTSARKARTIAASVARSTTSATTPRGEDVSLRWVLVHMIEEYARHNGHADLLRERIDGATGD